MSTRKLILSFFVLSLIGCITGYLLTNSYDLGLCYSNISANIFDVSCHSFYERVGNPLFYGMPALALVFLILLFLPQSLLAWKKFAKWFIPLATLLFIFYPDPGSGDYFSPYPEEVFKWVSIAYVIISIVIISWSFPKKNS